jgi:hypothetical protein
MAEIQTGVMLRSFLIALLIVAPVGVLWWRRIRPARQGGPTPQHDLSVSVGPEAHAPSLESVIDEIARLGALNRAEAVTVTIPHVLTLDGDPAPRTVVDALVHDALVRSGLVPTAELDTGEARVVECLHRDNAGRRSTGG